MDEETYYDEDTDEIVIPIPMSERQEIAKRIWKEKFGIDIE